MSASAASLSEALIASPVPPGSNKVSGAAQGLFSALLGDAPVLAAPVFAETVSAPGTPPEALAGLLAGSVPGTTAPDQTDPADELPAQNLLSDGPVSNEILVSEEQIFAALAATQEIPAQNLQQQSGGAVLAAGAATSGATIPVLSAPPALAGAESTGPQPVPGAGTPQIKIALSSGSSGPAAANQPAMPQAQMPGAQVAAASKPVANANSQIQVKKAQSGSAVNAGKSSPSTALKAMQALAGANLSSEPIVVAAGSLPAEGLSSGAITGQGASSLDSALATNNLRANLPQAASPVTSLAVQIASRTEQGARRFEIRMDPPELGRVDVRLKIDEAGNVSTRLLVERPETLELLQRDARALERALADAGLKTENGGVRMSLRHDGGDQQAFSGSGGEGEGSEMRAENDNDPLDPTNDTEANSQVNPARFAVTGALDIVV